MKRAACSSGTHLTTRAEMGNPSTQCARTRLDLIALVTSIAIGALISPSRKPQNLATAGPANYVRETGQRGKAHALLHCVMNR